MLRFLLQKSGYQVQTARNGLEALQSAWDDPPDVLITDILMPVMDGFTLCRKWQQDEQLKEIPFIFYTATYTDPEDEAFALNLGAERFIVKPVEPDIFVDTLQEVIREAENGGLVAPRTPVDEEIFLREYSETLVRKLEDKVLQLETSNQALEREVAERKRAERELRQHAGRLETLHMIDQAILEARSAQATAQAAMHHLRHLVPCTVAAAATFDFESRELTLFALDADEGFPVETGARLPLEGVAAQVESLREGGVFVEHDIEASVAEAPDATPEPPAAIQALQAGGVRSYVAAPLQAQSAGASRELLGALALGAGTPAAFTSEHAAVVREVADQLAVAIRQARLSAALETERRRLETTVDHAPAGIVLLDAEQRILLANPTARDDLHLLADVEVGDTLTRLGDRPLEELLAPDSAAHRHELSVPSPERGRGDGRTFELIVQPIGEAERQAEGWVLVLDDVTEQRQREAQVKRQERLAAVGQLAGGIAHDFRNFLASILLYADMAARHPDLPPTLVSSMEIIVGESEQATELVQQILDFSRRSAMKTQPLDLKPFVEEAVRVLERSIPENISVLHEAGPGSYVVEADPTRVQQVLMNLALNARDAMPEGGELCISLARTRIGPDEEPAGAEGYGRLVLTPGDWICLAVSDTGVGMTEEVKAHLFEPFFTTKGPGMGTGLGLAQVHGIVEQHHGHIDVETELAAGTTMRVYLPAHGGDDAAELDDEPQEMPRGRGETILVVEDEDRVRNAVCTLLRSLDYEVVDAADGEEALELCREEPPALVITDLVMPRMGGRALVRALRERYPHLSTLVTTGYAVDGDAEDLEADGILGVIEKPFEPCRLAQTVRRALEEVGS
jgi:PAS domain S-box-containing protein